MTNSKKANPLILDLKRQFENIVDKEKTKRMDTLVVSLKEATPVDTGEARDGWKHDGDRITNDVEHIFNLNQGSSQQAPAHFIEKTLLEHQGIRPSGNIVIKN